MTFGRLRPELRFHFTERVPRANVAHQSLSTGPSATAPGPVCAARHEHFRPFRPPLQTVPGLSAMTRRRRVTLMLSAVCAMAAPLSLHAAPEHPAPRAATYDALVTFFHAWRDFQKAPITKGAPNYSVRAMSANVN